MKKLVLIIAAIVPLSLSAQFFSGYYVSDPPMQMFDHFKIKQRTEHHNHHKDKYEGIFIVHAFIGHDEMWYQEARTLKGPEAEYIIEKYGEGREIKSVHKMHMLLDGEDWEFYMLGYLDDKKHGRFIVIEEEFEDETHQNLVSLNKFHWIKSHHLKHSEAVTESGK